MFPMPIDQIVELIRFAVLADKEARSDLVGGFITGENDYTSNFTGALRRNINSHTRTGLTAVSYVLPNRAEQKMGCDATIVIRSGDQTKVMLFEAKLPRRVKPDAWDYTQKSNGDSHFSDQLKRQTPFANRFAVFEMIYCEAPFNQQVPEMHPYLSSCAWHRDALAHDVNRSGPTWTYGDLRTLFSLKRTDISEILHAVCVCDEGEPMKIGEDNEQILGLLSQEFGIYGDVLLISSEKDGFESEMFELDI